LQVEQTGVVVRGVFRVFDAFGDFFCRRGFAAFALLMLGLMTDSASTFDYARYQPEDLDALIARKPPAGRGADVFPVKSVRFDVTLAAAATPCQTRFLKWAMLTSGIPKEFVDKVPISHCIQVKSAKGKLLTMFLQDALTDSLAQEVPPGRNMTVYAALVYFAESGPGLVINEFSAQQQTGDNSNAQDCGCGKDLHSGLDFTAPEGTPIQAMADGVIARVEQDEAADVDVPTAGKCGRYVVIKHSYPNGRFAYSRYAQLGRIVGMDGKPIAVGQQIKAKDKIGEVGSQGRFHFEIRPVDSEGMDQTPKWTQSYGADPSMEWSRYMTVDPQRFDNDKFAGKGTNGTKETPAKKQ